MAHDDLPGPSDKVTVAVWYDDEDEDIASMRLSTEDGRTLPVQVAVGGHWPRFGRLLAMLSPHLRRDSVEGFLDQLAGADLALSGYTADELREFVTA